jgi:hypothetical protein
MIVDQLKPGMLAVTFELSDDDGDTIEIVYSGATGEVHVGESVYAACGFCGEAQCYHDCDESKASHDRDEPAKLALEESEEDVNGRREFNAGIDAMTSLLLYMACAGIPIADARVEAAVFNTYSKLADEFLT